MAKTVTMDNSRRAGLEVQVIERLQKLDDRTLRELNEWLAQGDSDTEKHGRLTRRRLLALVGGAAVVGTGGIGVATMVSEEESEPVAKMAPVVPVEPALTVVAPVEDLSGTVAQLRGANEGLKERLDATKGQLNATNGLITLYEEMEAIELDRVLKSGLGLVAVALGRVAVSAAGLREGLKLAEQHVAELDQSFVGLDEGLARVEGIVTTLSKLMQGLEDRLRAAGEPVAPITDALGSFFKGMIERIPAVGPRIIDTIEHVEAIVGAIPETIENVNEDLVRPMRERFFPREGEDITVRLIDPLAELLFAPADRLLLALEELGNTWQSALQQPVEEKLEKRADLRKQIALYRGEKNL
ncbi:MAG: hypothetical protein M3220_03380 [Chloroflexota bacterium]|nr:hypothetical protein [Chloroflexota bacterium]